jgi:hypothetical protein
MTKNTNNDSMRAMRFMVFAMGVALIGGVMVLSYAGFQKIKREAKDGKGTNAAVVCKQEAAELTLPKGTIVPPIVTEKHAAIVTLYRPDGVYQLVTIDRCTGKMLNTLTLTPTPATEYP